jgi:hypothetical protein
MSLLVNVALRGYTAYDIHCLLFRFELDCIIRIQ